MESEIEIPKNECLGCQRRDDIILALARRIDDLEGRPQQLEKVVTTVLEIKEKAA